MVKDSNCFEKSRLVGNHISTLFDSARAFVEMYEDYQWILPIDYYEDLFYCMPTEICQLFNFNFVEFYDFILTKEKKQ